MPEGESRNVPQSQIKTHSLCLDPQRGNQTLILSKGCSGMAGAHWPSIPLLPRICTVFNASWALFHIRFFILSAIMWSRGDNMIKIVLQKILQTSWSRLFCSPCPTFYATPRTFLKCHIFSCFRWWSHHRGAWAPHTWIWWSPLQSGSFGRAAPQLLQAAGPFPRAPVKWASTDKHQTPGHGETDVCLALCAPSLEGG